MGIQKHMPLIVMILIQFIFAGLFLLSKAAISSGMKPSIFVAYRQAIATLIVAPFAFFFERKKSPPLTAYLLGKIFIVSSCGLALSMNLLYVGLKYVSATLTTALIITVPTMVFMIAVCSRIESLAITQKQGIAKVLGSIFGLTGAMIYAFYTGPSLYSVSENEGLNTFAKTHTKEEWIKGSIITLVANLIWSIWLILQVPLLKEYPSRLRLTTLQYGFCCLTTIVYGAIIERDLSSWKLGWNINLLSIAYSGIVVTGIAITLQVWVIEKRGPVYSAIFSPLALILTAIFSTLILHETLHLGSVIGGGLLAAGLYVFLWGKSKEFQKDLDNLIEDVCLESIIITSQSESTNEETSLGDPIANEGSSTCH